MSNRLLHRRSHGIPLGERMIRVCWSVRTLELLTARGRERIRVRF